jgi:hypothetical protein
MSKTMPTVCCFLVLLTAGCGGSENKPPTAIEESDSLLTQVGDLCRLYQEGKKKPPESAADLASVRTMGANGYEAIRTGKIVLRYGATLPDLGEEPGRSPSDQVLAYESGVPASGGRVLMLNRTTKTMTADEFKSAPKAGSEPKGSSEPKPASEK